MKMLIRKNLKDKTRVIRVTNSTQIKIIFHAVNFLIMCKFSFLLLTEFFFSAEMLSAKFSKLRWVLIFNQGSMHETGKSMRWSSHSKSKRCSVDFVFWFALCTGQYTATAARLDSKRNARVWYVFEGKTRDG